MRLWLITQLLTESNYAHRLLRQSAWCSPCFSLSRLAWQRRQPGWRSSSGRLQKQRRGLPRRCGRWRKTSTTRPSSSRPSESSGFAAAGFFETGLF